MNVSLPSLYRTLLGLFGLLGVSIVTYSIREKNYYLITLTSAFSSLRIISHPLRIAEGVVLTPYRNTWSRGR